MVRVRELVAALSTTKTMSESSSRVMSQIVFNGGDIGSQISMPLLCTKAEVEGDVHSYQFLYLLKPRRGVLTVVPVKC